MHEKQHEFALMMAIGISQHYVAADRLFEAGRIAIVDPILFIGGIAIALFAGVFSGLIPVVMTQRINIVRTLADR